MFQVLEERERDLKQKEEELRQREDEEICTDNTALYVLLPSALGFIALLHIILKFSRLIYWHFKKGTQKVYSFQMHMVSELFEIYSESHNKLDDFGRINSLLLHISFSKSKNEIKDICKKIMT